ncbi:hypothetical protein [Streptomyces roseus]|uniref:hypothetical protein n=1 Tax=Streptomyces roseus TaxID=66430 RepID=UPI003F4D55A0
MPVGDLLTLVQYDLPLKVVLLNNSAHAMAEREVPVSGLLPCAATHRDQGCRGDRPRGGRVRGPAGQARAARGRFEGRVPARGPAFREGAGRSRGPVDSPRDQHRNGDRFRTFRRQDHARRWRGKHDPDGSIPPASRAAPVSPQECGLPRRACIPVDQFEITGTCGGGHRRAGGGEDRKAVGERAARTA